MKKAMTVMLAIAMVVVMFTAAEASTTYMEFEVEEITDTAVSVVNSDGEAFWFSRPGFPIHEGQNVIIRSNLEYQGGTVWTWDPATTEFVGREEYAASNDIKASLICGEILVVCLLVTVWMFYFLPTLMKDE